MSAGLRSCSAASHAVMDSRATLPFPPSTCLLLHALRACLMYVDGAVGASLDHQPLSLQEQAPLERDQRTMVS